MNFKVKLNLKIKVAPLWTCDFVRTISQHRLKSGFPNLGQKCILALFRSRLILGLIDLDIQLIFNFKPVIFYQTFRLLFICVVLYIISEAIASECSTSHMASHIYRFLCTRRASHHGPWNSLLLYRGETIGVQPASTRPLALDFTNYYRFSLYCIRFTCRNCISQQSPKQQ